MTRSAILMFLLLTSAAVVELQLIPDVVDELGSDLLFIPDDVVQVPDDIVILPLFCAPPSTVTSFTLSKLCGKTYSLLYSSGIDDTVSCRVSKLVCDSEFSATVTEYMVVNDETKGPLKSKLIDNQNGVLTRSLLDANGVEQDSYPEYVTSFSEYSGNTFGMSCVSCKEVLGDPLQIAMVADFEASFVDERNKLQELYPNVYLTQLANTCDKNVFFPPGSK